MIRQQGYDWSFEEFTEGLAVVSAPIFDAQGVVIASIYVCGPTMRFPPEGKQHEITALVVGAGQEVSKRIAVRQLPLSHEGLAR
jgi:DNA-binding IclR family transcriptional regulator